MVGAPCGECTKWWVHCMVGAPYGGCTIWWVNVMVGAPYGGCTVWWVHRAMVHPVVVRSVVVHRWWVTFQALLDSRGIKVFQMDLIINKKATYIYWILKQFAMGTTRQDSLILCLRGTW